MSILIETKQGDIVTADTETIVNAANGKLIHGAGVAGAIQRAAGRRLAHESAAQAPVPLGRATWTTGGDLPYRYVLHAITMNRPGQACDPLTVVRATNSALRLARTLRIESVALPALGAGIGGVSPQTCANAMLRGLLIALHPFCPTNPEIAVRRVAFWLYDAETKAAFDRELSAFREEGKLP